MLIYRGGTGERIWFGTLTCSTAELMFVSVINENYQGLGNHYQKCHIYFFTVSGRSEFGCYYYYYFFGTPKIRSWTGSQLPGEVPSLMEDTPPPTMLLFFWPRWWYTKTKLVMFERWIPLTIVIKCLKK